MTQEEREAFYNGDEFAAIMRSEMTGEQKAAKVAEVTGVNVSRQAVLKAWKKRCEKGLQ